MLKSTQSIVTFDFADRRVVPDRLYRGRDDAYVDAARWMLRLYRGGIGRCRQWLHQCVEQQLSRLGDCPPRRIAAMCKLLDDLGEFSNDGKSASQLRRRVFTAAATLHPIVEIGEGIFENSLRNARKKVSDEIGLPWPKIESRLFADVIELQMLAKFDSPIEPHEFLSLYNVAQTQSALYRATGMRIDASEDFKTILRHAKLAGLMHRITRRNVRGCRGYQFELDGPQSSMRTTTRYGVRFARMLPKLLACRGWQMTATIKGPDQRPFELRVSPDDGLRTPLPPPDEFDSQLEQRVMEAWQRAPLDGWTMERESVLLNHGQTVLTPDFVLRHDDTGRVIYLEIVGYWTPEYLKKKAQRLRQFAGPITTGPASAAAQQSAQVCGEHRWLLLFPQAGEATKKQFLETLQIPSLTLGRRIDPKRWIETTLGYDPKHGPVSQ